MGGPLCNITRFTAAIGTGVTLNNYQVQKGNQFCAAAGLSERCRLQQGDFHALPFPDNHFDGVYSIEAGCHSPNYASFVREMKRVLKPGGRFVCCDWALTDEYDPSNQHHVTVIEGLESGNGISHMVVGSEMIAALKTAGFSVIENYDLNRNLRDAREIPWYSLLEGSLTLSGFRMTPVGRFFTHIMVWLLETLCLAPTGTCKVHKMLKDGANDLVTAGQAGIFTPSFYFCVEKPTSSQ